MLTKYLRVILFLCVLLWGTSVVDAQTKGIVVDGVKGRSLSDVNIYLQKDSVEIGSTDRNGEFMFSRDQITISDTIVFSHVGYFPLKCTLSELQHLGYKVVLHEHPQLLHEVVVSGERPPFFWNGLHCLLYPSLYTLSEDFCMQEKFRWLPVTKHWSEWLLINTGGRLHFFHLR